MPHAPEHRGLVNALIDHEDEAQEMIDAVTKDAGTAAAKLIAITRRLLAMRAAGQLSPQKAKALLQKARSNLLLATLMQHAPKMRQQLDAQWEREAAELAKLGGSPRGVAAIRSADKKARQAERKRGDG
jgi:uncharacterized protein YjaZ